MRKPDRVIGEFVSLSLFIYGLYLIVMELGGPRITGHVVSVITLNPTNVLFACILTVLSMAFFLVSRAAD